MPVTIREVAQRAQVSVATVSRALSAPDQVNPFTRARVLAVARQLGYRPSPAARTLITGRTGNIGIIVPDLANPFFTGVLKSVQIRARQTGHAVLLGDSDGELAAEEELVLRMARQVDGVLLCAPDIRDRQLITLSGATPLALLNRRVRGVSAALMDCAGGMRHVIEHLAALGHRRCAYLNGPRNSWCNRERRRGLRTTAPQHGVEVVELGPFPPRHEGGVQAADVAVAADVTAIIAFNDVMALGVLTRLRDRGIDVPGELSVTGFDDLFYASVCAPPLTTVAMPMETAGRVAVDLLLAQFADEPADVVHLELPTHLVVRSTTSTPHRTNRRAARRSP